MTIVAHLSDLHLLEPGHERRTVRERTRLRFLSFGRPLDAQARERRFAKALARTLEDGADHVCITGDLTEDGRPEQFEVFARVVHESGISPDRITIVPGNHDAYHDPRGFERALEGPLSAFRRTSGRGALTDLGPVAIVPVDTTMAQHYVRAAGAVSAEQLARLSVLARTTLRDRTMVVAQHHPPLRHLAPGAQWVAGLLTHHSMRALLEEHPHVHVVHGHIHCRLDRRVRDDRSAQTFCVPSVVEGTLSVRYYDTQAGALRELSERTAPRIALAAAVAG